MICKEVFEMYQKLLVPLDGSELGECVLPYVKEIARGCDVKEVILLEVIEPIYVRKTENASVEAAREYLSNIQSQLSSKGVSVSSEVLVGKTAWTIIEFAERNAVDLIAIAKYDRSGIRQWVRGSVADKISCSSRIPVLMIRPPGH